MIQLLQASTLKRQVDAERNGKALAGACVCERPDRRGGLASGERARSLLTLELKGQGWEGRRYSLSLSVFLLDRPTFLCSTGLVRLTDPGHC